LIFFHFKTRKEIGSSVNENYFWPLPVRKISWQNLNVLFHKPMRFPFVDLGISGSLGILGSYCFSLL